MIDVNLDLNQFEKTVEGCSDLSVLEQTLERINLSLASADGRITSLGLQLQKLDAEHKLGLIAQEDYFTRRRNMLEKLIQTSDAHAWLRQKRLITQARIRALSPDEAAANRLLVSLLTGGV